MEAKSRGREDSAWRWGSSQCWAWAGGLPGAQRWPKTMGQHPYPPTSAFSPRHEAARPFSPFQKPRSCWLCLKMTLIFISPRSKAAYRRCEELGGKGGGGETDRVSPGEMKPYSIRPHPSASHPLHPSGLRSYTQREGIAATSSSVLRPEPPHRAQKKGTVPGVSLSPMGWVQGMSDRGAGQAGWCRVRMEWFYYSFNLTVGSIT